MYRSNFSIVRVDEVPALTKGYPIIPKADNFPLKNHVVLPLIINKVLDDKEYEKTPFCINYVLLDKGYDTTLYDWLTENKTIHSELFHVKVDGDGPLDQIVRPTKKGLAMVRALLKVVGLLHGRTLALCHPVDFGVSLVGGKEEDPEYEIVIIQGRVRRGLGDNILEDIRYMEKLIFETVLSFPKFTNCEEHLEEPRLPVGLTILRDNMSKFPLIVNSVHYSTLDWQSRKNLIKTRYDRQDCVQKTAIINWDEKIPDTGIVRKYYEDDNTYVSSLGKSVAKFDGSKGELLRFMRHFSTHIKETEYTSDDDENVDDFKSEEYVECVLSEIFQEWYHCFLS